MTDPLLTDLLRAALETCATLPWWRPVDEMYALADSAAALGDPSLAELAEQVRREADRMYTADIELDEEWSERKARYTEAAAPVYVEVAPPELAAEVGD